MTDYLDDDSFAEGANIVSTPTAKKPKAVEEDDSFAEGAKVVSSPTAAANDDSFAEGARVVAAPKGPVAARPRVPLYAGHEEGYEPRQPGFFEKAPTAPLPAPVASHAPTNTIPAPFRPVRTGAASYVPPKPKGPEMDPAEIYGRLPGPVRQVAGVVAKGAEILGKQVERQSGIARQLARETADGIMPGNTALQGAAEGVADAMSMMADPRVTYGFAAAHTAAPALLGEQGAALFGKAVTAGFGAAGAKDVVEGTTDYLLEKHIAGDEDAAREGVRKAVFGASLVAPTLGAAALPALAERATQSAREHYTARAQNAPVDQREAFLGDLGLDRSATQEQVKSAVKRVVRETHPDVAEQTPEVRARFDQAAAANREFNTLPMPEGMERVPVPGKNLPLRAFEAAEVLSSSVKAGDWGGARDALRTLRDPMANAGTPPPVKEPWVLPKGELAPGATGPFEVPEEVKAQIAKEAGNDRVERQGVPSEVGVGKEPVEAGPDNRRGGTPPQAGRTFQEQTADAVAPGGSLQKAVATEPAVDGAVAHAEPARDLGDLLAGAEHGFAGLDVPSRRAVMPRVLALIGDDKIFRAVVPSIPVDVVNQLAGTQLSAEDLLHNKPVLIDALSRNDASDVVAPVVDAIVRGAAGRGTEAASVSGKAGVRGVVAGAGVTSKSDHAPVYPPTKLKPEEEKVQGEAPADMKAQEHALLAGARQAILFHKAGPQPDSAFPPFGIERAMVPAGEVWFRTDTGLTAQKVKEMASTVEGLGKLLEMPPGGRPAGENPKAVSVLDSEGNEVWSAEVDEKTRAGAVAKANKMAGKIGGSVTETDRTSVVAGRQERAGAQEDSFAEGAKVVATPETAPAPEPPKPAKKAKAKKPALAVDMNRQKVANHLKVTIGDGWEEELVGLDRAAQDFEAKEGRPRAEFWKELANDTIGAAPAPEPIHKPVEAPKVEVKGWESAAHGPEGVVETATGTEIPFTYAVVDAREPVTSHDSAGNPNPGYALEGESIQNRNRSHEKSVEQMGKIKGNPKLRLLAESPTTNDGAPLVRPDKRVLAGNGRMAGLAAAHEAGTAEQYKKDLPAKLKQLGFDDAAIEKAMSLERPALVRLMKPGEEYDHTRLARDTNVSTGLQLGPAEKGRSDAGVMTSPGSFDQTSRVLALFEANDDANLTAPKNRAFVEAFAKAFVPETERGAMFSEGRLTPDGAARVRAALVAGAYGKSPVVDRLLEGGGEETVALRTALVNAAPDFAIVNMRQKMGELEPLDVVKPVIEAAEFVNDMRGDGRSLESVLHPKYGELIAATDRLSPEGLELVQLIDQNKGPKGARILSGIFRELAKVANELKIEKDQGGLFGEGEIEKVPVPTLSEALKIAKEAYEVTREAEDNPLFAGLDTGAGPEEGPREGTTALEGASDKGPAGPKATPPDDQLREADTEYGRPAIAAPTFFSAVERAIDAMPFKSMPARDLALRLTKTPGVKREELDWIGLPQWLEGKDRVSKDEVKAFLEENRVEVKTVELANEPKQEVPQYLVDRVREEAAAQSAAIRAFQEAAEKDGGTQVEIANAVHGYPPAASSPETRHLHALMQEAMRRHTNTDMQIHAFEREHAPKTKYEHWTLPGGENYREVLLQKIDPRVAKLEARRQEAKRRMDEIAALPTHGRPPGTDAEWDKAWWEDWRVGKLLSGMSEEAVAIMEQRDKIYDQMNAIELRQGQINPKPTPEYERLDAEFKRLDEKLAEANAQKKKAPEPYSSGHFDTPNVLVHYRAKDRIDAQGKKVYFLEEVQSDWGQALRRENQRDEKMGAGVPPMPFSKTWPLLAFKHALRYAAENGYDSIAWTPGEVQAARYDLSKHIDSIKWGDNDHRLATFKNGSIVSIANVPPDKLPDHVGKEMAQRLLAAPKQLDGVGKPYRELSGLDLRIGGEGMKGFYDKILPAEIGKYIKPWGGKVGETYLAPDSAYANDDAATGTTAGARPVHEISITPAMREAALSGQALFEKKTTYDPRQRGLFDDGDTGSLRKPGEEGKGAAAPPAGKGAAAQAPAEGADRGGLGLSGKSSRYSLGQLAARRAEAEKRGRAQIEKLVSRLRASVPGGVDPDNDPLVIEATKIAKTFRSGGFVSLIGHDVPDIKALGVVAQVAANPAYETLRVALLDDDNVLVQEIALSAHLPAGVSAHLAVETGSIETEMKLYGATKWALIHNHPGGDATPSSPDVAFTTKRAGQIPGFMGHVVIDHDSFATIDATGKVTMHDLDETAKARRPKIFEDPDATANAKHLGVVCNGPEDVAKLAINLHTKERSVTLLYVSRIGKAGVNKIRAIGSVPFEKFLDFAWATRRLRLEQGFHGAQHILAYSSGKGLSVAEKIQLVSAAQDLAGVNIEGGATLSDFLLGEDPRMSLNAQGITREASSGVTNATNTERLAETGEGYGAEQPTDEKSARQRAFEKWFEGSKVVNEDGTPKVVYHGTSGDFEEFNPKMADPEGNLGAGFYFTSDPADASDNYHLHGPDMESRIQRVEENLMQEAKEKAAETGSIFDEEKAQLEATRAAHAQFRVAHEGAILPVYLQMKNPLVLSPENGLEATHWDARKVRRLIQILREFSNREVFREFGGSEVDKATESIENYAYDGEDAGVVLDTLRDDESPLMYVEDDEGRLVMGEVLRKAVERMGYDGIIDPGVAGRFPGMALAPETVHYIAFHPWQIKSATGNRGTFSRRSNSIIREEPPDYGKKEKKSALDYASRFAPGASRALKPRGPEDEVRLAATDPTAGVFSAIFANRAPKASKTSQLPSPTDSHDPEVERRMRAAEGIVAPTILDRVKKAARDLEHSFTRHFIELDTKESSTLALDVDILRQLEGSPDFAKQVALDALSYIADGLDKPAARLFTRILALRDLHRSIDEGLYEDKDELPFGYEDKAAVTYDLRRYEAMAAKDEAVAAALTKREKFADELTQKLVDMELLPEDVLEDDRYYHRQVMAIFNQKEAAYVGTGSQDVRLHKKGFQKARSGGGDFNLRYQEAEFEWMAQAHSLIAMREALDRLREANDIKPGLDQRAKWQNTLAIYGGIENYNEVQRLKGELAAIYTGGDIVLDSEDRKRVAAINQKLEELDPLRPFSQRIGWNIHDLKKKAEHGELDHVDKRFQEAVDQLAMSSEWEEFRGEEDTPDLFFPLLNHLLENGKAGSIEAGGIFKAIADRKKFIKTELGKEFKTWRDLIPETHPMAPKSRAVVWQPEKGSMFYRAQTLPERALERFIEDLKEAPEEAVDREALEKLLGKAREGLVMGGPKPEWVIPEGLAKTLDNWKGSGRERGVEDIYAKMVQAWKQWVLLNPTRALPYSLNNQSGDLDVVIAAFPGALRGWGQAARDLWGYTVKEDKSDQRLVAEIQRAMKLGVISSGQSVQEIPDINEAGAFKGLTSEDPNVVQKTLQTYWSGTKKFSTWRENTLRLALFRYLEGEMARGAKLYGASKPHEVDAIKDPADRAAKVSRELIGDYGNISVAGQFMRHRLMPFYSWIEINSPRYVRLLRNAAREDRDYIDAKVISKYPMIGGGGGGGDRGSAGSGGGGRGGRYARVAGIGAKKIAVNYAKLAILAPLLYGAVQAWNNIMFPEEEKLLSGARGGRMYLIIGRAPDGSILTVRFQGALSDALGWFGAGNLVADTRDVAEGRRTIGNKLKDAATAPIDKIVGAWEPFSKSVFELAFGYKSYPSLFKEGTFDMSPSKIRDKYEYAGDVVWPVGALYRKVTGKPKRPAPDLGIPGVGGILSALLTRTDPGEAAYWYTRNAANKWLEDQGKSPSTGGPTGDMKDRADALYYFKKACEWGDDSAASKWLVEYYRLGGTPQKMNESFVREHPLGGLPLGKRGAFLNTLSDKDRTIVQNAVGWYEKGRERGRGVLAETPFTPAPRRAATP